MLYLLQCCLQGFSSERDSPSEGNLFTGYLRNAQWLTLAQHPLLWVKLHGKQNLRPCDLHTEGLLGSILGENSCKEQESTLGREKDELWETAAETSADASGSSGAGSSALPNWSHWPRLSVSGASRLWNIPSFPHWPLSHVKSSSMDVYPKLSSISLASLSIPTSIPPYLLLQLRKSWYLVWRSSLLILLYQCSNYS